MNRLSGVGVGGGSGLMMMSSLFAKKSMSNMSDMMGANVSFEVKSRQMVLNESFGADLSRHHLDDAKSDLHRSLSEITSLAKNVRLKYSKCGNSGGNTGGGGGQVVARATQFSNFNGTIGI